MPSQEGKSQNLWAERKYKISKFLRTVKAVAWGKCIAIGMGEKTELTC